MNINLKKAKQEFITYTENYDLKIERLKEKQKHSLRVMEISKQMAKGLGLSKEEIEIATLIGLLHDIARFEQYTKFQTFKDIDSIDHGNLGAEILQNDIRKYIETNKYDEIIIKSIKNHNKLKIEDGLTEKEKLFSKIVRDADKIDIFYQSVEKFWKGKEDIVENSIISKYILEQIEKRKLINTQSGESAIDNIIKVIAFIFDINFQISFQILKDEDYINEILNRYDLKDEYTKNKVEQIRKIANEYIKQNLR